MITYDSSLYKEVEEYYNFLDKENDFYRDLEDLLSNNGSKSNRILQPTSGEV
jgi:hypothetical protein